MHGEWWLENPALSISLFCIAFYLLYRALRTKKQHRYHQHSDHNDVQRVIFGQKIIDTRYWLAAVYRFYRTICNWRSFSNTHFICMILRQSTNSLMDYQEKAITESTTKIGNPFIIRKLTNITKVFIHNGFSLLQ